jgi:hypothetical protein
MLFASKGNQSLAGNVHYKEKPVPIEISNLNFGNSSHDLAINDFAFSPTCNIQHASASQATLLLFAVAVRLFVTG